MGLLADWKYDSQVYTLNQDEDIIENGNHNRALKNWKQCDDVLQKVSSEINALGENESDSVLQLIAEKVKLLKHIRTLHKNKGKNMSQIMFEAAKRIKTLQSDLQKKNEEMATHLEVKQTMYAEIQN